MSDALLAGLGPGDIEERIRRELEQPLGAERQRRYRRFLLEAMSSVPWVGGLIAAMAAIDSELDQGKINELQQEWLDVHKIKLKELGGTLVKNVVLVHGGFVDGSGWQGVYIGQT